MTWRELTILLVRSGRDGGGGGGSGCSVSVGVDDDGLLDDTRDTEEPTQCKKRLKYAQVETFNKINVFMSF